MGRAPLLEASNLVKRYNGRAVVDHLSFEVGVGEIVGLLGRNGAGKTTSFRMTVGMIDPEGGTVVFEGEDVTRLPMYRRAQRGMGYLSQSESVFQRLSVWQNLIAILETMRDLSKEQRRQRAEELIEQFGLTGQASQEARTLSGGEKRKLEIARALVTEPSLLMLDEPFSGVDPIAVEELQTEILRLRKDAGIAILLTDHNVRETLEITDRSYIIDQGRELRSGTPAELVRDPVVRRTYLGSTFSGDEFDGPPARSASAKTKPAPAAISKSTARKSEPAEVSESPPAETAREQSADLIKAVDTADLEPPEPVAPKPNDATTQPVTESVVEKKIDTAGQASAEETGRAPSGGDEKKAAGSAKTKQNGVAKSESVETTAGKKKSGKRSPKKKAKRPSNRGKKS